MRSIQTTWRNRPRSQLASEQPAQLQSQGWSPACPATHLPRQESQGEALALAVHLSLSVRPAQVKAQRWSEQIRVKCQSRVSLQMPFLRIRSLEKSGILWPRKNAELPPRGPAYSLAGASISPIGIADTLDKTKSALGPIPALKFSSSCAHTSDWCRKVKPF